MFGEIEGVNEGQIFENRRKLHDEMSIGEFSKVLERKELLSFYLEVI